jgi:hypothetical protein
LTFARLSLYSIDRPSFRRGRYSEGVTTPIRPLPAAIELWMARWRWLRWGDALVAWLAVLLVLSLWAPRLPTPSAMALAAGLLLVVAAIPRVRQAWRPLSAVITLRASRGLRPGDRAWFVHGGEADLVLVTARRGLRMVIARPDQDAVEGLSVRRTRVLILPA